VRPAMLKCILIADDDAKLRKVLRFFIELRLPSEVCGEAIDGVDAIAKAGTLNPDLIILDFYMPRMNGVDVGAALRPMLPGVPVILFTGKFTKAIEFAAISAGIRAVVPKPELFRLLGHLENLLDSHAK
jgi:DNA-binding NarL/FixJ family response regulator